ncbi:hypothetical protein CPAR01_12314 [Colletotrichum paranaense]|uniref:Uncharacterized protein n=3 Tax=Colletotrichum acutatum species complex TaxID=2707335 RepID=A0AAI9UC25_9PEZI|nr:uncharacterized protein CPAR01_12314 [Colletotrichum paranaense]KAI3538325.1 hypothetical protein CSPX01_09680 [Colletotrichum filicis]KAK1454487.1 hypothetical protein CMEL01_16719 [Colletotrichum melonis]KAK1530002.1 hypothetical protein CPAR01_12314 [Colletotrichum paranaense]
MRVYYAVIRWLRHIPIASNGIQNPRLKAYIGSIYLGEVRQRNVRDFCSLEPNASDGREADSCAAAALTWVVIAFHQHARWQ